MRLGPGCGILRFVVEHIDVAAVPAEAGSIRADCFIVVDVLRATTTLAVMFERGARRVTVTASVDAARELRRRGGGLLCGEVQGLPPPGFDHGNSPVEFSRLNLRGQDAILSTTNGTAALCAVAGRGEVLAGAPANVDAVIQAACQFGRVAIVCAGNGGGAEPAEEDLAVASLIVARLGFEAPTAGRGDGALRVASSVASDWTDDVRRSPHAANLTALGFREDIEFAVRLNTLAAVPRVTGAGEGWAVLEKNQHAPLRRL